MPTSAWLPLTTFSSDSSNGGGFAWTDPSNASGEDDTDAVCTFAGAVVSGTSEYLKGLQVIGASANWETITQVDVRVRSKISSAGLDLTISRVSLVIGGSIQTEQDQDAGSFGTSYSESTLTLTSDLPTVTEALASNFGVVVEVELNTPAIDSAFSIDVVEVRFTYTVADPVPFDSQLSGELQYYIGYDELNEHTRSGQYAVTGRSIAQGLLELPDTTQVSLDLPSGIMLIESIDQSLCEYGPIVGGNLEPWGQLLPGETHWFRLINDNGFAIAGVGTFKYVVIGE